MGGIDFLSLERHFTSSVNICHYDLGPCVSLQEQMNERELEREEFQREIEKLRQQVQDKDKQEGSHVSLHREVCEAAFNQLVKC